jgi:hypothetical protein
MSYKLSEVQSSEIAPKLQKLESMTEKDVEYQVYVTINSDGSGDLIAQHPITHGTISVPLNMVSKK